MTETTSRVAALEVTEEAISTRIKHKSRQMREFHQDLRKTLKPTKGTA